MSVDDQPCHVMLCCTMLIHNTPHHATACSCMLSAPCKNFDPTLACKQGNPIKAHTWKTKACTDRALIAQARAQVCICFLLHCSISQMSPSSTRRCAQVAQEITTIFYRLDGISCFFPCKPTLIVFSFSLRCSLLQRAGASNRR